MPQLISCIIFSFISLATFAAVQVSSKPVVFLHVVGDGSVLGEASSGGASSQYRYSFRRALYHILESRGYHARFVGSKNDCEGSRYLDTELDFDSHHDGFANPVTVRQLTTRIQASGKDFTRSVSLQLARMTSALGQEEDPPRPSYVSIIVAGANDAAAGVASKAISDSDLTGLTSVVEQQANSVRSKFASANTVVVVPPPPGGRRASSEDGSPTIERDFQKDSRYEDFRFFLTWRGHFFDKRRIALDCFSHFDFLNHYDEEGSAINNLGEQSFARCIFDHLVKSKYIPPPPKAAGEGALVCNADSADAMKSSTSGAIQPALVNGKMPHLTSVISPAVIVQATSSAKTAGGDTAEEAESNKPLSVGCLTPDQEKLLRKGKLGAGRIKAGDEGTCKAAAVFEDALFKDADTATLGSKKSSKRKKKQAEDE